MIRAKVVIPTLHLPPDYVEPAWLFTSPATK